MKFRQRAPVFLTFNSTAISSPGTVFLGLYKTGKSDNRLVIEADFICKNYIG
jgi:hypothetical protein